MPAPEGFEAYPFGQDAPGVRWFSVTPNDTEPLTALPRCMYVGGAGDLAVVKTAGASGQPSTVGDEMADTLGIPKDSVGIYKFANPGNASATCIFTMWGEEVVP